MTGQQQGIWFRTLEWRTAALCAAIAADVPPAEVDSTARGYDWSPEAEYFKDWPQIQLNCL